MEIERTGPGEEILADVLASASNHVLVSVSEPVRVRTVIRTLRQTEDVPNVRLLTGEATAKTLRRDFLAASTIVDAVDRGTVEFRTVSDDSAPLQQLIIAQDGLVSLIWSGDDRLSSVTSTDAAVLSTVSETYEALWEEADGFSFHTPGITQLLETVEERLGPDMRADVDQLLGSDASKQALDDDLGEVDLLILAAAKNREEFFELNRWGEAIELASIASFSFAKQELEEQGLIQTEKVPQERGRPRHRLVLAEQDLKDIAIDDLVTAARQKLR